MSLPQVYLLDEELQLRREDRRRLPNGDSMTRLLLRAGLHPILDIDGVAWVLKPTTANCIKNCTQLAHVTVNRLSGKMQWTAAVKLAMKSKMRAVEDVDLSTTALIAIMQKADDVGRRCVEKS